MTPDQADRLRNLFMEARKTTRLAHEHFLPKSGRKAAHASDDAAVEAFMDAVAEMTTHD